MDFLTGMTQDVKTMLAAAELLCLDAPLKVESLEQGWGRLGFSCDILRESPLRCGGSNYDYGFGTHADARIRIKVRDGIRKFHAFAGPGEDRDSIKMSAYVPEMSFQLEVRGKVIAESPLLKFGEQYEFSVDFPENTLFCDLLVTAPSGISMAHAVWACPDILTNKGEVIKLGLQEDAAENKAFQPSFPVCFQYGEMSSEEFYILHGLRHEVTEKDDRFEYNFISQGDGLRMSAKLDAYKDYPVWEWHARFENISGARSRRLSRVRVVNLKKEVQSPAPGHLVRRRGSFHNEAYGKDNNTGMNSHQFGNSYCLEKTVFEEKKTLSFGATGGRNSVDWLPMADIVDGESVLRAIIGWPGQWTASVQSDGRVFDLQMGLEDFDAVLEAGEAFDMPSGFLLYSSSGGDDQAGNIWRRFVTSHVITPVQGELPQPPISFMHWGGLSEEMQQQRVDDIIRHDMPMEVFWIDAGWFAEPSYNEFCSVWGENVGDWKFHPDAYPDELKEVSRKLHEAGKKLLLWFEPERVRTDRDLAKEHPDFLIFNDTADALLDLGNPEAWQWCFDTISGIIERNNIDWYREDFNFSPLEYWRSKDAPDRKGVTEMRFTDGLYRFWRELRKKFPHLMIDNCASGGRRMDIELLRYSLPLWYSDMQCWQDFDPELALSHIRGFSGYWPRFSTGLQNPRGGDTYNFRAGMTAGLGVSYFYTEEFPVSDSYPRDWLKKNIAEYETVREYFSKDFYCLAAPPEDRSGMWTAFQYNHPEKGSGIVTLFRGEESCVTETRLKPRGLDPDAIYEVTDIDKSFAPVSLSGREFMDSGFAMRIETARTARIVSYRKI